MNKAYKVIVSLFFGFAAMVVVSVHKSVDALVIWNLFPVIGAWFTLIVAKGLRDKTIKAAAHAAGLAMAATVLLLHLLWFFDVSKMASGSSTAALVFLFIPFWATACALVVFFVALPVVAFVRRRRVDPDNPIP